MISTSNTRLYAKLRLYRKRVLRARGVVAKALSVCKNPYVSFSTGKDSTCVMHLVLSVALDTPVIYFDADCAFPESIDLIEEYRNREIPVEKWRTEPLLDTFRRYGLEATRIEDLTMESTVYEPARRLRKERGYDCVFLGLRRDESRGRLMMAGKYGEIHYRKRDEMFAANPILFWSEYDVWTYIHENELPYNKAYEYPGVDRISYWAGETMARKGRWVELKRHWPELYNRFAAEFPEVSCYA